MTLYARILELEKIWSPNLPGTQITRVMLDNAQAVQDGLEPSPDRDSIWAWRLALGAMPCMKQVFHGNTISAAVEAAESWLTNR